MALAKESRQVSPKELYDHEPRVIPMICYTAAQEAVGNEWVSGIENLTVQRLPLADEVNTPESTRRVFLWRYLNTDVKDGGPDIFDEGTMGAGTTKDQFIRRVAQMDYDKALMVDNGGFLNHGVVIKVTGDDGSLCFFLFKRETDEGGSLQKATLIPDCAVVMDDESRVFETYEPVASSVGSYSWAKFEMPRADDKE